MLELAFCHGDVAQLADHPRRARKVADSRKSSSASVQVSAERA